MNEKYYFTLAEAARLVEVNARKLAAELDDHDYRLVRYKRNFYEVLYSLEDLNNHDVPYSAVWLHEQIKKMFILFSVSYEEGTNCPARPGQYALTITEASRLTEKSRSWILKLIQEGKIKKFEGRRIKDAHKKKSLVSVDALRVLGLDFKPDDVFKLFTLSL